MFGAPDTLEPSMGAHHAPSMARDGPTRRTSATRTNSTVRLRSGGDVETAVFSRWTTDPGDNAQCVGSREAASAFRSTVDTRHQAAVAVCCTGPSRAMDGAWGAPMDGSSESGVTCRHLRRDFSTASRSVRPPPNRQHNPSLEPLSIRSIEATRRRASPVLRVLRQHMGSRSARTPTESKRYLLAQRLLDHRVEQSQTRIAAHVLE